MIPAHIDQQNLDPDILASIKKMNTPLNDEQRLAAETTEGPIILVAGAGAGKTKTLIHRAATLLKKGVPATNLLLVTFTSKAAEEIKTRLQDMVGEDALHITAGTFHSVIYNEIIRKSQGSEYLTNLGYIIDDTLSILDDSDSDKLLKDAIKELTEDDRLQMDDNGWNHKTIKTEMSLARAEGYDAHDFISTITPGCNNEEFKRISANVWSSYTKKCRDNNGIDFDDILVLCNKMLKREPYIAEELSYRFKYIFLDEYQDTNNVQMSIMDTIAKQHENPNIFVVGDEKQCIYGFRGANNKVILKFKERYDHVIQLDLTTNYRSLESIIVTSNALATAMNERLSHGQLKTMRQMDIEPTVAKARKSNSVLFAEFHDQAQEAKMIRLAIQRDLKAGVHGKDIAILYRNRNLKTEIERELVEQDIPYKLVGDTSFYGRKEVRDAISMIRFIFKPADLLAAYRLFKCSRLPFSEDAIKDFMKSNKKSVKSFLENKSKETKAQKKGQKEPELRLDAKKAMNILDISKEIRDAAHYLDDPANVKELLARFWDKFLKEKCENEAKKKSKTDDNEVFERQLANVQIILDKVEEGLEREMEIEDVINDLVFRVDHEDDKQDDEKEKNTIQLMTIHASKGLEFKNVYLVGMDNVTSPGPEAEYTAIEEERRIMYVGLTRAEDKLAVSYARNRIHHGKHLQVQGSPFLDEIEAITKQKRYIAEDPAKQTESSLG